MESVPPANVSVAPLDEHVGLPSGSLSPRSQEHVVHLAIWIPFRRAGQMLERLTGVQVSEGTAHRQTSQIGGAVRRVHNAPACMETGEQQRQGTRMVSPDGAMVPLVGGPWADVKTVVVGEVQTGESAETIHSTHRSSFSRMEHAQPFPEQASRELLDRGVAQAEHMCAVRDGAEWIDGFVDWPRKDAGRLLDVAHAADSVSSIRHLAHTAGSMVPSDWLTTLLHVCKQEGPPAVLQEVKKLRDQHPEMQDPLKKVASRLSREGRMPSPQSHAAG